MNWQRCLEEKTKGRLKINERLARHTSFKIGGPVQFWVEPKSLTDLQNLVNLTYKKSIPLRIIGAGSNILVDDRGIKGIVVKLNAPCFKRVMVNQQIIKAGAGLSLNRLVGCAIEFGLSGLELLSGIPGTVGGALVMNAGNIGDRVLDVTVMDNHGRVKILTRKYIQFNYRSSNLNHYIILSANFKLTKKNKRVIKKKINDYLDYRRKTQDLSWPSAGCFFRNPSFSELNVDFKSLDCAGDASKGDKLVESQDRMSLNSKSAAYFIERCGLKGSFIGDAAVSSKHANFIINKGKARFVDILTLMTHITKCVKKRFNLDLKPEIKIWKQA